MDKQINHDKHHDKSKARTHRLSKKVQEGKGQEKAQSEKKIPHSKNRGGKKLTIRYVYHENILVHEPIP